MARIKWRKSDQQGEKTSAEDRAKEREINRRIERQKRLQGIAEDMAEEVGGKPMFMYITDDDKVAVIAMYDVQKSAGVNVFIIPSDAKAFDPSFVEECDHYCHGVDMADDIVKKKSDHLPLPRKSATDKILSTLRMYDSQEALSVIAAWSKIQPSKRS
jgi:hypothetical protein